jgi:hypothetical protein
MKTAAAALILVALASPALAGGDGDNANMIRASIYQTVIANQTGQVRWTPVAQNPRVVAAPVRRTRTGR